MYIFGSPVLYLPKKMVIKNKKGYWREVPTTTKTGKLSTRQGETSVEIKINDKFKPQLILSEYDYISHTAENQILKEQYNKLNKEKRKLKNYSYKTKGGFFLKPYYEFSYKNKNDINAYIGVFDQREGNNYLSAQIYFRPENVDTEKLLKDLGDAIDKHGVDKVVETFNNSSLATIDNYKYNIQDFIKYNEPVRGSNRKGRRKII